VAAGITNGDLVALNAADGKEVARAMTQNPIYSSPVIENGFVFVGSDDSGLYAFGPSPLETYKAVPVDPTVLDKYVGEYDTGFGMKVSVTRDSSKLMVKTQNPAEFEALSPTHFFNRDLDMELDFGPNQITMSQGGFQFPLKKI